MIDGVWLRWWRTAWRATTAQMAAKVGVTRMTVYRWETGKSSISAHVADWMREHMPSRFWTSPDAPPIYGPFLPATEDEMAEMREMEAIFANIGKRNRRAT